MTGFEAPTETVDVAVVGAGPAGRRVASLLGATGLRVSVIGSGHPAWGVDDEAGEPGVVGFEVHRARAGVPTGSVRSRWLVLATGAVAESDPVSARLRPRAESALGRSVGCRASWQPEAGGWVLDVDERMRTSVPGILAVGGVAGARGEAAAIEQAEVAAATVTGGATPGRTAITGWPATTEWTATEADAVRTPAVGAAGVSGAGAPDLPDSLLVCPCEGIRLGQLRRASAEQPFEPTSRDRKLLTRLGMGECQGRVCGDRLARIDEAEGRTPTPLVPRAPVIPLLIPAAPRKD